MQYNEKPRKTLYFLPFICTSIKIEFDDFSIIPISERIDVFKQLVPEQISNMNPLYGSLIETPFFKSGDIFNNKNHINILRVINLIRFVSMEYDYCYITNQPSDVFDYFIFMEGCGDPSSEHKITYYNGISNFKYSATADYLSRIKTMRGHNIFLNLDKKQLNSYTIYKKHIYDDDFINIISAYNKTRRKYPLSELGIPILYSRMSIEVLIKIQAKKNKKINLRNYCNDFCNCIDSKLKEFIKDIPILAPIYEKKIMTNESNFKDTLDSLCSSIAEARHDFTHEGINPLNDYKNKNILIFYIVFFPLLLKHVYKINQDSVESNIELLNFLILLKTDVKTWIEREISAWRPKKTVLEVYADNRRIMPILINSNDENSKKYLANIVESIIQS